MTAPDGAGYGRSTPAPTCPCGAASEWVSGRGRWCSDCLPADHALRLLRSRLREVAATRFGQAAAAVGGAR